MLRSLLFSLLLSGLAAACSSCGSGARLEEAAREELGKGNYVVAERLYREALKRTPEDVETVKGLAAALFGQGKFRMVVGASAGLPAGKVPSRLVFEAAARVGLAEDELLRPALDEDDIPYLRRIQRAWYLARRMTASLESPEEKLQALFDWVVRNIQSAPIPERPDLPAWPYDVIMRGYGACDRSAWAFVTLARALGFRAYLVVLWDKETDTSPHSLAGVLMDGKLRLFDTFYGMELKLPSGEPAGLNNVIYDPEVMSGLREVFPGYRAEVEHFRNAIVTLAPEPWGMTARMEKLGEALRLISPAPPVFMNLQEELGALVNALYGETGAAALRLRYQDERRPYSVDLWGYPFNLKRDYETAGAQAAMEEAYSFIAPIEGPRYAQITGNFETALMGYSKLLSSGKLPAGSTGDTTYFRALCMYELGSYDEAAEALGAYVESDPDGAWGESANYNLAMALEKTGRREEAMKVYGRLGGTPRGGAAALRLLELKKQGE